MFKRFDPHAPYFWSVAMALIVSGSGLLAFGGIEWLSNIFLDFNFATPSSKIIGGLIVIALGYIQLELELIRVSRK